ncbi:Uncharacterised protein [Pantoea agglomerans]|uniref:Uncharacterized protein n=1 Tax=Enterobacter agglomerans TaxID=549 RepID=A0A379LU88_ENTAG|nr:Uncharacterised protein [Pantoea agglomerans]
MVICCVSASIWNKLNVFGNINQQGNGLSKIDILFGYFYIDCSIMINGNL